MKSPGYPSVAFLVLTLISVFPKGAWSEMPSPHFLLQWGAPGIGPGLFKEPLGAEVGPNGHIYVADREGHNIQEFDTSGNFLALIEPPPIFSNPTEPGDIVFGIAGELYVSDLSNNVILQLSNDGSFLSFFGGGGNSPGRFDQPVGLAFDQDYNLYVADAINNRIQKFDSELQFVLEWGTEGTAEGAFKHPLGVACGPRGEIFVSDTDNGRIQRFEQDGTFVKAWGSQGWKEGRLYHPKLITISDDDVLFVAEEHTSRVSEFTLGGEFIDSWGTEGKGEGEFEGPYDICFDASGFVYVVDTYNNRVQKFQRPATPGIRAFSDPSSGTLSSAQLVPHASPNPFRDTTKIEWTMPDARRLDLSILDVTGRLVRSLNGEAPGPIQWDGRNSAGEVVPDGLYFYRISSEMRGDAGKLVKLSR